MAPADFDHSDYRRRLRELLQLCLSGVTFPATKEDLASSAESIGATPHFVLHIAMDIRSAPFERFGSFNEVLDYLTESGGWAEGPTLPGGTSSEPFPGDWTGGGPDDL